MRQCQGSVNTFRGNAGYCRLCPGKRHQTEESSFLLIMERLQILNSGKIVKAATLRKGISRLCRAVHTSMIWCFMPNDPQRRKPSPKASEFQVGTIRQARQPERSIKIRVQRTLHDSGRRGSTTDRDAQGEIYESLHLLVDTGPLCHL